MWKAPCRAHNLCSIQQVPQYYAVQHSRHTLQREVMLISTLSVPAGAMPNSGNIVNSDTPGQVPARACC